MLTGGDGDCVGRCMYDSCGDESCSKDGQKYPGLLVAVAVALHIICKLVVIVNNGIMIPLHNYSVCRCGHLPCAKA